MNWTGRVALRPPDGAVEAKHVIASGLTRAIIFNRVVSLGQLFRIVHVRTLPTSGNLTD